jgi:glycosyltransferase involved in cell wall biosynthesis
LLESPAPGGLEIRQEINSVNPFNWLRAGLRIRNMKPDVVIIRYWLPFMGPAMGTIARLIRTRRKSRIISLVDNMIPHERRVGDKLFTRYFIKPIHGYVAMSEAVMEDINKFDSKKPRAFCPHPLFDNFGDKLDKRSAKAHLLLDQDTNYALFFGFIRDYKGLDLALKAFGEQELKTSNIKLLVAGEFYTDEKAYREIIASLGIEEKIDLRNEFIPDEDVKYYFSATDLVVQPYKSATQSGISQIAYHFNKPMVVTNVGGLPEIVPDGKVGFVVEKNEKALAAAILRFYNEGLEEKFSRGAEEFKQHFSWQRMVDAIDELLTRI